MQSAVMDDHIIEQYRQSSYGRLNTYYVINTLINTTIKSARQASVVSGWYLPRVDVGSYWMRWMSIAMRLIRWLIISYQLRPSFGHHDETCRGRTPNHLGGTSSKIVWRTRGVLSLHMFSLLYAHTHLHRRMHRRLLFCSVLFLCISIMAQKQKNMHFWLSMIHMIHISDVVTISSIPRLQWYIHTNTHDRFCVGSRTTNRRRRDFMLEKWNTHKKWRR